MTKQHDPDGNRLQLMVALIANGRTAEDVSRELPVLLEALYATADGESLLFKRLHEERQKEWDEMRAHAEARAKAEKEKRAAAGRVVEVGSGRANVFPDGSHLLHHRDSDARASWWER